MIEPVTTAAESGDPASAAGSGNMASAAGSGDMASAAGSGNMASAAGSGDMASAAGTGDMASAAGTGDMKRVEEVKLSEGLAKMIVILRERTNELGPRREDDQSQAMPALPFGSISQSLNGHHGLSQPAIAARAGNVSCQHAQAQIDDNNQIATRRERLIPITSPARSRNPQDQAS